MDSQTSKSTMDNANIPKNNTAKLAVIFLVVLFFVGIIVTASRVNNETQTRSEAAVLSTSPSPTPVLPWLKTIQGAGNGQSGKIVRVDNGQPVELRGVNVLHNEWVYPDMTFENAAFPILSSNAWHANLVTHGFASAPVAQNDAQYMGILDQYQQLAEQNHMYIIFAYYYPTINGDQPPRPDVDTNWRTAMENLVTRYRNRSNVIFMLQAEPHSDTYNGTYYSVNWNTLRPVYDAEIARMRNLDNPCNDSGAPCHLILGSGDGYGRDVSAAIYDEYGHGGPDPVQNAANFVYSSHPYDTRAGSNDWDYVLPVADAGYTVLITEFGTGGQMAQSDTLALMSEMNNGSRHIGWTAWIYDGPGGCPCLLSSGYPSFGVSSPYGTSVRDTIVAQATQFGGPPGTPVPTMTLAPSLTPTRPPAASPTPTVIPTPTFTAVCSQAASITAPTNQVTSSDVTSVSNMIGLTCSGCAQDLNHDGRIAIQDVNLVRNCLNIYNPTPTRTPTPAPTGTQITITFEDYPPAPTPPASGDYAITGQYPVGVVTWGTGWFTSDPWRNLTTRSLIGRNPGGTFTTNRRLTSIKAYTPYSNVTVSITCSGLPSVNQAIPAGAVTPVNTGWTSACPGNITLTSSNGNATNFDDMVLQ